ncbi:uncharacterized protein BCR38DRAFT_83088 [Pseudomassariella vexata]|uniref:Uncharacterized protein n=1 Tax=Pseudomassariella vexata TaxID=1141098 RepID=A0A1Y2DEC8_9PEZI|nr:uncharacterized protein BCR38DRAFT_83088 [Pseudomassariella vexata]ORY57454.1 hypothetical protein BCR38DRAFT_83088 [Pseudomassariella vexata]
MYSSCCVLDSVLLLRCVSPLSHMPTKLHARAYHSFLTIGLMQRPLAVSLVVLEVGLADVTLVNTSSAPDTSHGRRMMQGGGLLGWKNDPAELWKSEQVFRDSGVGGGVARKI